MPSTTKSAYDRPAAPPPATALKEAARSTGRDPKSPRPTPHGRRPVRLIVGSVSLVLAAAAAAYLVGGSLWQSAGTGAERLVTAKATRVSMPIVIVAGGELESAQGVEVFCELEGTDNKIVEMLPEGSPVEAGQVVMRLDPSAVNDRLAAQQIRVTQADALARVSGEELKIQRNVAASEIAQAELELTLARLDKKKYLEGDYSVEFNGIQGEIALAKTGLQEAEDMLEYYRDLVKKGFRTPEQLRAKEQEVEKARFYLQRDQEKLQVLENFTRVRQEAELTAKAEEAAREVDRVKGSAAAAIAKAESDFEVAKATAKLEHEQLERIKRQLDDCEIRAPVDGTLVYAKERTKRIELGEEVHYKQTLFSLPDMSEMQVKAFVHESEVKKVKPDMPASLRVDAVPGLVLKGTVTNVSNFYDATRQWLSGGVKEYATTIQIDSLPGAELKPGMTTRAEIRVGELDNSLVVPIAAVAEKEGQHYCYVVTPETIERRKVKIGANTQEYVEILNGLSDSDEVALDARYRADSELDQDGPPESTEVPARSGEVAASR